MLAVGNLDEFRLVDAVTGRERWKVQGNHAGVGGHVVTVAMAPDGRFVATVDQAEEFWKLWDAASGVEWMAGARHDGTGACVCSLTRSGRRTSLDQGCPVRAHTRGLHAVAFSPCGQRFATGSEDTTAILWDAQTGKAERVLQGHTHIVSSLSFSADGAWLASGSWDGSIRVWDATTGVLRTMVEAHELVFWVQFSPTDARRLASVGYDAVLRQWDIDGGALPFDDEGHRFAVFSPDGHTIATGCPRTNDVLLIDTATIAIRLRLVAHLREVYSANFSVDGSKLASGSIDGTCRVWDSSTGALLNTIEIHGWNYCVWWGRDWVLEKQRSAAFAMGHHPRLGARSQVFFFFLTLVAGRRRSLSLKLSDTRVYEPQIRARLAGAGTRRGAVAHDLRPGMRGGGLCISFRSFRFFELPT